MKQRITHEQWLELTPKGVNNQMKWLDKKREGCKKGQDWYFAEMTIGEMIEFLGNKYVIKKRQKHWWLLPDKAKFKRSYHREELADALWEACKEILND